MFPLRLKVSLLPAFIWATLLADPAFSDNGMKRPNIVFVLVDDMGWTDLGCYGSQYFETPRIDQLAREGMRFTDAYAACAVCSPTRAAIMTGRYPARVGVTDWIRARFQGGAIPSDKMNPTDYVGGSNRALLCPPNPLWMEHSEVTLAEVLKDDGYVTCHIGKWHLGADEWYPEHQGFDFNYGGCDYGQPPHYFDPYENQRQKGIPGLPPRKKGEYLTDREADEAVEFIRAHRDRPFFLYLANYAVHTPIQAKPEVTAKYEAKPKTNQKNAKYAAMVESVDDAVGRVLDVLRELALDRTTVIVFTSDNGGLLGPTHNAPLRSGKGFPYEGGIRVPLIVKWPGLTREGSLNNMPVSSVDYLPTFVDALTLDLDHTLDGQSLLPTLKNGQSRVRDLFWHFPHYRGKLGPYSIVRSGDWKLIHRYDGDTQELYHLGDDLSERHEISSIYPSVAGRLANRLDRWLGEVGAKLPMINPSFSQRP